MKEEVVIISGDPENVFKNGKDLTEGFTKHVCNKWKNPTAILGEPQFAAIHVKGTSSIQVIIEIDSKSKLEEGIIVAQDSPILVNIPVRYGNDKLEGIRYTTFRKLITHKSTDDL